MIASNYTKTSNSLGFQPILQTHHEMICEIPFFQNGLRNFLDFFCRSCSSFVFCIVKSKFRNRKSPKVKISRDPFLFKKIPRTILKALSAKISWKHSFFTKTFFQRPVVFLTYAKPLILYLSLSEIISC